jgi:hypothetical protein
MFSVFIATLSATVQPSDPLFPMICGSMGEIMRLNVKGLGGPGYPALIDAEKSANLASAAAPMVQYHDLLVPTWQGPHRGFEHVS